MASQELSDTSRFKPLLDPSETQRGEPFPRTIDYGTVPPLCQTIARNRVVPFYLLGWIFSDEEILEKYDPERQFKDSIDLFGARLNSELGCQFPQDWKRSIPKLVGHRSAGPTGGQPFIIRIAHNANPESIELSKNQDFVEFAKKALDLNEDPKWYSR